jgi:hypothetical protein
MAAGESRFACSGRVEYVVGNLPLILSAPHGGRLKPAEVPSRTNGTLFADTNTDKLAREIARAVRERTGGHAHRILCHLHRVKVDCNRELAAAAEGHPEAEAVWQAFHGFIGEARDAIAESGGPGLYIDVHGHAHPEPRLELGYMLRKKELELEGEALEALRDKAGIRDIVCRTGLPFAEWLRGDRSLGALVQKRGYRATPSPQDPASAGEPYLNGGYNVRRYAAGSISGIQIEFPGPGVRDTAEHRRTFANAFAEALVEYMASAGIRTTPPPPP